MTRAWSRGELWGFPSAVEPYEPYSHTAWRRDRETSCTGCGASIQRLQIVRSTLKCFACKSKHKRDTFFKWIAAHPRAKKS